MRFQTSSEIRRWLAGQGMHHRPLENGVPLAGDFKMPGERRSRADLAEHLADLVAKDGNKLVELLPAPGAREGEWQALDGFRRQRGAETGPFESPGHLFKSADREDFRLFLSMLMGFEPGWSFYVYSAPSHSTVLLNGRVGVWSAKKGLRNELGRHLLSPEAA